MKNIKLPIFYISVIVLSAFISYFIFSKPKSSKIELYSYIGDFGEVIDKVIITYDKNIKDFKNIDTNTYTINAKSYIQAGNKKGSLDYDLNRKIEYIETTNNQVILYLNSGEGKTFSWTEDLRRNVKSKLEYTVVQNTDIDVINTSDEKVVIKNNTKYVWDNKIINDDITNIEYISDRDGINYHFYNSTNSDKLIVWFVGSGESGFDNMNNKEAPVIANDGFVSFIREDIQNIFNGANVVSFQPIESWSDLSSSKKKVYETVYKKLNKIIEKYGINKDKIVVAGCSSGGYMATEMIIKYPDLFASAIIACPALSVNNVTDEDLESMKKSKTAIWLVQGETDGAVATEDNALRMFNILSSNRDIITTRILEDYSSSYTTYETLDDKYKLSLYDTVDRQSIKNFDGTTSETGLLKYEVDFNRDGESEVYKFLDHFSWIYPLNNTTKDSKGVCVIDWSSKFVK